MAARLLYLDWFTSPNGNAKVAADRVFVELRVNIADSGMNLFADVNLTNWFYESVKYAQQSGLFAGTGANAFSPQMAMTRGMVVTVQGRLAGVNAADYSGASYQDVNASAYYGAYVKWTSMFGISNTVSTGKFEPNTNISRQDLAFFLCNYALEMGIELPEVSAPNVIRSHPDPQFPPVECQNQT